MAFKRLSTALRALPGLAGSAVILAASRAAAQDVYGHPVPGQIGFERGVTPIAHEIHFFHNWILMPIITAICVLVAALLIICIVRFNERAHPIPSRTTHNAMLEVAWTIIPVLILVVIAIPSFRLLTNQLVIPHPDLTIKVTGHQWYWSYAYPKSQGGGFEFDSFIKNDKDLKPGDIRLLSVDNDAVVPINKVVKLQITSTDVIHGFVVQAFGVRIDAIPGRLNETWFKAERVGTYYGECSLLCGQDHAFMPIVFQVVSQKDYQAWLAGAQKKFASLPESFAENDAAAAR